MSPWHPLCIPFYHHFCSGWWLVVSTPLKNISRLGLLFHILWKNNIWNHQPVVGEMPKKSWFYPIIGQLEVWRSCLPKGRKVTEKVMRWTKSSTIIGHGLLLGLPVYQIHNWNIFEAVFGFEAARSYTLYQDLPLEQWHTHTRGQISHVLLLRLPAARFRSQRTKNMIEIRTKAPLLHYHSHGKEIGQRLLQSKHPCLGTRT